MRFSVGRTKDGQYSWWLHSSSDMVAWAGETSPTESNARRAAEAFKAGAPMARYDVYLDDGRQWRWRAWRSSDKVASSGESFASRSKPQRPQPPRWCRWRSWSRPGSPGQVGYGGGVHDPKRRRVKTLSARPLMLDMWVIFSVTGGAS